MSPIQEKAAALKARIEASKSSGQIVEKVTEASTKNPTAAAFNIWHANSDVGIGSDKPWGSQT